MAVAPKNQLGALFRRDAAESDPRALQPCLVDSKRRSLSENKRNAMVTFENCKPQVTEYVIDDEELRHRWYSREEYFFIKKEALSLVRRMGNTRIAESDFTSTRGLEIVDETKARERREHISEAVQKVIHGQQKKGSHPEHLASISSKHSKANVRKCVATAAEDARDVESYLADTKESWTSTQQKTKSFKRATVMRLFSRKSTRPAM